MFDFARYGFDSFLWMPVTGGKAPSDKEARTFLKFIQSCDNQPAHMSGGTRSARALLLALLRYAVDGWTMQDALREGQRLNRGAPLSSEQVTWLLGWAASHSPGSERLNACSTR
jgi:hypothetical protein